METNMKHYLLALSIGTAFLVGCQSPQKQNLIDSNFAFAEQQLKYAFPKIDEARANESQESKEKRIAKQWGELTNPRNTEPDGLCVSSLPKTGPADSFPVNSGMYMNIHTILSGKRKQRSIQKCWNAKRRTALPTTWDSRCIAATAMAIA